MCDVELSDDAADLIKPIFRVRLAAEEKKVGVWIAQLQHAVFTIICVGLPGIAGPRVSVHI